MYDSAWIFGQQDLPLATVGEFNTEAAVIGMVALIICAVIGAYWLLKPACEIENPIKVVQ